MPTGRTTKLTPTLQTTICQAVAVGVPLLTAAQYAGVAPSTVMQWLQRGEGRASRPMRQPYVEFVEAVQKARAQDEVRRIARLEQAAKGGQVVYRKTTETVNSKGEVVR